MTINVVSIKATLLRKYDQIRYASGVCYQVEEVVLTADHVGVAYSHGGRKIEGDVLTFARKQDVTVYMDQDEADERERAPVPAVAMTVLRDIINSLPSRRDWLDPTTEQAARDILAAKPASAPLTDDEALALFSNAIGFEHAANWKSLGTWPRFFSYADIIKAVHALRA